MAKMYCAIVIPYRVRVVIPASEMWEAGHAGTFDASGPA